MAATGSKADTSECERETLVRRSAIAPKALVAAPDSGRKGNKQLDRNSLTDLIAEGRLLTHASPHVFYHCDLPSLAFPFGIAAGDVHTLEIRSYMCFEALPATTGLLLFGCPIACWLTERAKSDEFCIENLCYTPRLVQSDFTSMGWRHVQSDRRLVAIESSTEPLQRYFPYRPRLFRWSNSRYTNVGW